LQHLAASALLGLATHCIGTAVTLLACAAASGAVFFLKTCCLNSTVKRFDQAEDACRQLPTAEAAAAHQSPAEVCQHTLPAKSSCTSADWDDTALFAVASAALPICGDTLAGNIGVLWQKP
jgi:hypothetical protein